MFLDTFILHHIDGKNQENGWLKLDLEAWSKNLPPSAPDPQFYHAYFSFKKCWPAVTGGL